MFDTCSCWFPAGDLMTVNLNLAGLPAVCLPCGFAELPDGGKLPVGMQVNAAFLSMPSVNQLPHLCCA